MAEQDRENLHKYLDVIKKEDKVAEHIYEERLKICKQCELLFEGTCQACGCYVEFRGAVKSGKCPKKKWTKCGGI